MNAYDEARHEHELDLEKERMIANIQHKQLEKRVSKLEELYEEELMHRDEEEEIIQRTNKANEMLVKIKLWLQGTVDAEICGGDLEEMARMEGVRDFAIELLEQIEEWENEQSNKTKL